VFRLNVLGGLALYAGTDPVGDRLAQRRRLALLALVALEGEHGISRDRLAAFLWPDTDAERSRHALAQLVYVLRRDSGIDDLVLGQEVLRLNPERITVDVLELVAARVAGDHERVVELYRGPLLDGVHLSGTVEFEHWLDVHRQRFAADYEQSADTLVARSRETGDYRRAIAWARRRAQLAPFDSRAAAQLVDVLADAGELAAAMAFAEKHDSVVRDELGHAPDAGFAASVRRLRELQAKVPEISPPAVEQTAPVGKIATTNAVVSTGSPTKGRTRMWAVPAAVLLLSTVGIVASGRHARSVEPKQDQVSVLPFDISAPSDVHFLGKGIAELLSTSLEATGVLRPTDPQLVLRIADAGAVSHATPNEVAATVVARTGAQLLVRGALVQTAGRLRLTATLYDARKPSRPLAAASVDGVPEDLFQLIDRAALSLVAGRLGGLAARFEPLAERSTRSLDAVRAFVEGEAAFRGGRYLDAIDAFQRATQSDSTFALAYYRLALALDWAGYPAEQRFAAAASALRNGARLPQHERDLLQVVADIQQGRVAQASQLCRSVLAAYPNDVAAWYQLGEIEFHYNPWLGRSFLEARSTFEHLSSLAPEDPAAPIHLARIAAFEGRRDALDSLVSVVWWLRPGDHDPETALVQATAAGRTVQRDSVLAALSHMSADTLVGVLWRVVQFGLDVPTSLRVARLLLRPGNPLPTRRAAYYMTAFASAVGLHWPETRLALDSLRALDPTRGSLLAAVLAVAPDRPLSRSELQTIRADLERGMGSSVPEREATSLGVQALPDVQRAYYAGLLSTKAGDRQGVDSAIVRLAALPVPAQVSDVRDLEVATLRADSLALAGHPDSALGLLRIAAPRVFPHGHWLEAPTRFRMAELADRTGNLAEAELWYNSFAGGFWADLLYVADAERALAKLARVRGDSLAALDHERRYRLLTR
jgi:DNA-binding SARP family transcriptional activator/tetratricopeptide (TPR) repeat protein